MMAARIETATLAKGDGGWAREVAVGVDGVDGLE